MGECEESTSERQRQAVLQRSGGRCEAEVLVSVLGTWTRCFASPVEVHHLLTRSRGGVLLDRAGEDYHLCALCLRHHRDAHGPGAHEQGLLIPGYVTTGANGQLEYLGPDPVLNERYPSGATPVWI